MQNILYKLYKKFDSFWLIATTAYYINNVVIPKLTGKNKSCRYDWKNKKFIAKGYENKKYYKDIKIAFVCDEMTYKSFKDECTAEFLTPFNWLHVMESFRPDIFFCESAWNGIDEYKGCWRGRIYKNKNVLFNNRKDLFNILDYCKRSNIKTVFWNKEDPVYFDNNKHNFSDTAVHFDYIFTTSKECIKKYRSLGHKNVHTLMFGFNEKLFNPINSDIKENKAVFAGSWYAELKERCTDLKSIFDFVKKQNIELKIYDRNYNTSNKLKEFPKEFKSIISKNVPFEELRNIYRNVNYVININTIKDSETMFARRVFEIMACNTCVISNESLGMKKMFGNKVWFINEEFEISSMKEICAENVQYVMENHTNNKRIKNIYDVIGIQYIDDNMDLSVIYENVDFNEAREHFKDILYENKSGYFINGGLIISIEDEKQAIRVDRFIKNNRDNYFVVFNNLNKNIVNIKKSVIHFSYLHGFVGICNKGKKFTMEKSNDYFNCVFETKYLETILSKQNIIFDKYIV